MKNTMISSLRQALLSKAFFLGVFAFAAIIFLASTDRMIHAFRAEYLLDYGFHGSFVASALTSDTIAIAIPIICAIPYTGAYINDIKTGFIKVYLQRTSRKDYIISKIVACAVSGGLVLALGILLAYGISVLCFSPLEATPFPDGERQPYFEEIVARCSMIFLSGAFGALLGMTLSAEAVSIHIAYASPFIVFYVLIILHERYFNWLYVLYPREWVSPSDQWAFGNWGVMLLLIELIIIVSLRFSAIAYRRLLEL